MPKPKKVKVIEPYWQTLVELFFSFTRERKREEPTFDGSSPRDLKAIIQVLKKRAETKGIEWTEYEATSRLFAFLDEAYKDVWLSNNWILSNINRQKDKVFFNAAKKVQWLGQ